MDSVELRGCPFCGEDVTLRFDADGGIAGCNDPHCAGFVNATPAEWNRRTAPAGEREGVIEPEWVKRLGSQYGARQAATLRGDKAGIAAADLWIGLIARECVYEILSDYRALSHPAPEPHAMKNFRPIDEYVAELEQDPVMKAALDKARAELRASPAPDTVRVPMEQLQRWYDTVRTKTPRGPHSDAACNEMFAMLSAAQSAKQRGGG